jgi:hypothetical protein
LSHTDGYSTQSIPFGNDPDRAEIVSAHIVDPYILLLCEDGSIELLKADDATNEIGFCKLTSDINVSKANVITNTC